MSRERYKLRKEPRKFLSFYLRLGLGTYTSHNNKTC